QSLLPFALGLRFLPVLLNLGQYLVVVDDIVLNNELQYQRNQVRYGIIPGQRRGQTVEHKQQDEGKNIRHVFQRRVALVGRHVHIVQRNQEAGAYRGQGKQAQVITQSPDIKSKAKD